MRQTGGELSIRVPKCRFQEARPAVRLHALWLLVALLAGGSPPTSAIAKDTAPKSALESETRSPVTLYDIGVGRLVLGDLDGAEKAFLRSLGRARAIGIDFAPPHEGMARLLLARGKLDPARFEALAALELDRNWTPTYLVLGKIEEREGNAETALAHYERGLVLNPVDEDLVAAATGLLRKMERSREAGELEERARRLRTRAASPRTSSSSPNAAAPGAAPSTGGSASPADPSDSDTLGAGTVARLRPFFPEVAGQLSPRLLAVFQQPRFTRGALAVLAIGDGEHGLGRLFERSAGSREGTDRAPEDIRGRPEERWIHRALAGGVLDPLPDHTFQADQCLSRSALALWAEEIVERIRRDSRVFGLYRDQPSPFSDLPAGHYALNAARLVMDLKLLPPVGEGRFGVDEPVSMAEGLALLERLGVLLGEPGPSGDDAAAPATGPRRK